METAVGLIRDWCAARPIGGLTVDVQRLPGLTPLIVCEVAGDRPGARRPHGAAVRAPRQAAGDDRVARRARSVDAGRSRATGSTAAAAPTTATPPSPPCSPSRPPRPRASPTPACSCSSRPARRAAAPTCRRTSRRWPTASARPSSSSASTPAASTPSACGSRRRCAGWSSGDLTVEVLDAGAHSGQASGVVPVELPHHPPAARPHRGQRDRSRPRSPSCTSRSPPDRIARGRADTPRRSRSGRPTSSRSPAPRSR